MNGGKTIFNPWDAWRDLIKVAIHFFRLVLLFTIPVLAALFFAAGLCIVQLAGLRLLYAILGSLCIWRSVTLIRLAIRIWKAERTRKPSSIDLSVPIPFVELGRYFECAQALQPKGWWLEEASLVRSPILILEQKNWREPPTRVKIGLAILAMLSKEEARCLMTYKVARYVHFPCSVDRVLERIHIMAKRRIKPPTAKAHEPNPGAILWGPLYRHTAKSVERNEQFARNWTSAQCGKELLDATIEKIKTVEQAWTIFENNALRPLLLMGGIPPVTESFRDWFAQSGNALSANIPGEREVICQSVDSPRNPRLAEYERQLYIKALNGRELKPIPSHQAYASLGPVFWQQQSHAVRDIIADKELRDLPDLLAHWPSLFLSIATSSHASGLSGAQQKQKVIEQLYFASLAALSNAGWIWQVPPVQPVILSRNGIQICPQVWIQTLLNGSLSPAAFERTLEAQGVSEIPFAPFQQPTKFVM